MLVDAMLPVEYLHYIVFTREIDLCVRQYNAGMITDDEANRRMAESLLTHCDVSQADVGEIKSLMGELMTMRDKLTVLDNYKVTFIK